MVNDRTFLIVFFHVDIIVSGGHQILLPFIWTMLGQVRNFTTYLTTTTLWINAMLVFRTILAQMPLLFANKAACKLCTPVFNWLGAFGKRMSRFTTVIAKFL